MAAFCKYARNRAGEIWFTVPSEIQFKKVTQYRLGEIGGAGGETGGRESEGSSDLVKFLKWFQNGRI